MGLGFSLPWLMRLLNVYKENISDGPGLRYSIYLAGCRHACPGCHNPESWSPDGGILLTERVLEDIIEEIRSNPLLDGITVSGGDPFFDPDTGFTIEYLLRSPLHRPALEYIDVLVDGPFVESLLDPRLSFRGSSNQRLIEIDHTQPLSLEAIRMIEGL